MIVEGVQCDACTKLFRINQFDRQRSMADWDLPLEWITLFQGKVTGAQALNFCSKHCLRDWVEKEIIAREPKDSGLSVSRRRLILSLTYDACAIAEDVILSRARTFKYIFAGKFPNAMPFQHITQSFPGGSLWKYILRDAQDEHIRWAAKAKECGLIDGYLADYDPED